MLPGLRDGDRLLVVHDVAARPGDVVVARLPDGTVALKRLDAVDRRGCWLESDNTAEGWSSRRLDQPVDADRILAVARWRLWPRPRRVARSIP